MLVGREGVEVDKRTLSHLREVSVEILSSQMYVFRVRRDETGVLLVPGERGDSPLLGEVAPEADLSGEGFGQGLMLLVGGMLTGDCLWEAVNLST